VLVLNEQYSVRRALPPAGSRCICALLADLHTATSTSVSGPGAAIPRLLVRLRIPSSEEPTALIRPKSRITNALYVGAPDPPFHVKWH
jgi:hypothetical protein